jgi:deoxyribodipyrimidine photo-lyase
MNDTQIAVFWFRRDLRLDDNAALYYALRSGYPVLPLFIFDAEILDELSDKADKRVQFIHREIVRLQTELRQLGSDILVRYGHPVEVWKELLSTYKVAAVYTNHDYEPYGKRRDESVREMIQEKGAVFYSCKDVVIFEKDEVLKDDGTPYTVFTPYSKRWKAKLTPFYFKAYPTENYFNAFCKVTLPDVPLLTQIGFQSSNFEYPDRVVKNDIVKHYTEKRDFPYLNGTSKLGVHLRFGTLSIRKLLGYALSRNETFVNELIWRDFYHQILHHFPYVQGAAFRKEYDDIEWVNNELHFDKWCNGQTGVPLVDAGMRELNATGYIHNRVRMVVASFLTKNLLIDWRWGEAYFAEKLLDFDLAANNGGWQWAAGCGTDAAPYFRIFNPLTQAERFDPQGLYIKKWVPEYGSAAYPKPVVDIKASREDCMRVYQRALKRA